MVGRKERILRRLLTNEKEEEKPFFYGLILIAVYNWNKRADSRPRTQTKKYMILHSKGLSCLAQV